jgi:hypothetical protein
MKKYNIAKRPDLTNCRLVSSLLGYSNSGKYRIKNARNVKGSDSVK